MIAGVGKTVLAVVRPNWLTGPIFEKELRVSSRRRRNYALRFFYIFVLAIFVGIVWLSTVEYQSNSTFQQSRMGVAGKEIVSTVIIFQFIAMQLLAVIMLSNAISDEVYHRTLGLLMTTPINSFQIVMGKVLSKLLQLLLLLAITLPILAIVRVLGGVPWGVLLSSLCITLTATLLAGSLSLLLSIRNRLSYGVILRTVGLLCCLYFVLPALAVAAWALVLPRLGLVFQSRSQFPVWLYAAMANVNPFFGIQQVMQTLLIGGGGAGMRYYWPLQCTVTLGLSALILAWAVAVVRKVALRQATGQLTERERTGAKRRAGKCASEEEVSEIKRVRGPAVVWRELRAPFIQGIDNRNSYIGFGLTVLALLLTYLAAASEDILDTGFVHGSYVMLFMVLGAIINVIFAATRITTEKESQSLLLLLTTPLSDWDILFGKGVSAVRRCLPIWSLLAGHVLLFVATRYIHPVAIIHLFVLVAWLMLFITGMGLYFSTRFARTTSAVVASFALGFGLWAVGPMIFGVVGEMLNWKALDALIWAHPAAQAGAIVAGAMGAENAQTSWRTLSYPSLSMFGRERTIDFLDMMRISITVGIVYSSAAWLFLWRAKCRLRRSIF